MLGYNQTIAPLRAQALKVGVSVGGGGGGGGGEEGENKKK